jgi:hypothetical protein
VTADLLRNTLKLSTAVFVTAAIAVWTERIAFVWYPLLAVVMVVDDNDDHTFQAASGRVMGTILGGLITFMVHTVLSGWAGVLVSMLLMVPLLQLLGWQGALGTAGITSIMFLMIPSHTVLNWDYVFNRALDTAVGCLVAIAVGLLFWPRNAIGQMEQVEAQLRRQLSGQLQRYSDWLERGQRRPRPLDPAPLTSELLQLEQWMAQERAGPRRQALLRGQWEQRLRLWQLAHSHWVSWERLLEDLKDHQIETAEPLRSAWRQLAIENELPLLPLLALAEEWRPLHACLGGLGRITAR